MTDTQRTAQELADELEQYCDESDGSQYGTLSTKLVRDFVADLRAALASQAEPLDMVLHCPNCGMQHIDAPEQFKPSPYRCTCAGPNSCENCYYAKLEWGEWKVDAWTNPPHRSHLCHGCGHIWRPADVPTNGVQAVKTKGKDDSPIVQPAQAGRDAARWRELVRQHEIDDDQATHNNYGRSYPRRTLCVFQDDGEDGLEPVSCDPGELTRVVDAAIAAKEQQS